MIPFTQNDAAAIREFTGRVPEVLAEQVPCSTEDEWLAARRAGLGASEIGAVMGWSSWTSPFALWWRKKLDWRVPRTSGQQWGHLVEEPIAQLFAETRDDLWVFKPVGAPYSLWRHPQWTWMLCTPDRLAVDRDGNVYPVELKSNEGGDGWGPSGGDEVPDAVRAQALWQAVIFGATGTYVVRKRGSGAGRLAWYWIPADPQTSSWLILCGLAFLDSIREGQPPEPDGSKSTTAALQEINPAIDAAMTVEVSPDLRQEWRDCRAEKRDAALREAKVSNALRAAMGRAEYASVDGVTFVQRAMGKRSGYSVGPATTDQLREVRNVGEPAPDRGLRPSANPEATPPSTPQGTVGGDPSGGTLVPSPQQGEVGADPQGVAVTCTCGHGGLDRMFHLASCPMSQRQVGGDFADNGVTVLAPDNVFIDGLPQELRTLAERAQAQKETND